jgi:lysosomal acid lipase/cholesteryl ester hydrolase
MVPSLGKKLSVFIALAPAVYAGPLTTGFPFTALNRIEWSTWKRFFGVLDFIPLMRWAYNYCPAKIFVSPCQISTKSSADEIGNAGIVSLIM